MNLNLNVNTIQSIGSKVNSLCIVRVMYKVVEGLSFLNEAGFVHGGRLCPLSPPKITLVEASSGCLIFFSFISIYPNSVKNALNISKLIYNAPCLTT